MHSQGTDLFVVLLRRNEVRGNLHRLRAGFGKGTRLLRRVGAAGVDVEISLEN